MMFSFQSVSKGVEFTNNSFFMAREKLLKTIFVPLKTQCLFANSVDPRSVCTECAARSWIHSVHIGVVIFYLKNTLWNSHVIYPCFECFILFIRTKVSAVIYKSLTSYVINNSEKA